MENVIKKPQKITITAGIMLVQFLAALDMLIVAIALPKIAELLQGGEYQTWVVMGYTLVSCIVIPVAGKLSDIYGRKYLYIAGIITFVAGSALCGFSQSMIQLIIFRGIQGIGGGIIMGVSMAIISDIFPPAEVGKYMGIIMSSAAIASLIGPSLGGFLTDHLNWHWIFFVNIPVGILAAIALSVGLPAMKIERDQTKKVDFAGAALVVIFTIPLLLALTWGGRDYAWSSGTILSLFAVAVAALAALIIVELKVSQPIIPMKFFRQSIYTVANSINFLISISMFGAMVFMPQFTQYLLGYSPSKSGGLQTPLMVLMMVGSVISGQLVSRVGKYKIFTVIGSIIALIGSVMLCTLNRSTNDLSILLIMGLFGFGFGILFPTLTIAIQNTFSKTEIGSATASFQFFKNFATSIGVAILGTAFTVAQTHYTNVRTNEMIAAGTDALAGMEVRMNILSDSFRIIFVVCTVIAVATLIIAFFLKDVPLRKENETIPEMKEGELS